METLERLETPLTEWDRGALRSAHLQRLGRLLRLRARHGRDLNARGRRLVDRSVFSAYCDCREAGAEEEARALIREALAWETSEQAQLSFLELWGNDQRRGLDRERAARPNPTG